MGGNMLATGAALGAGSALGHAALGGMLGSGRSENEHMDQYAETDAPKFTEEENFDCEALYVDFRACLNFNRNRITKCQEFFNKYNQCLDRSRNRNGAWAECKL